jgi:CheY-like chemotaxis protein
MSPGCRILVIDDNQEFLDLVGPSLTEMDFRVETCASGQDGLERLAREHFDLVITDICLPGGVSGVDVARHVRRSRNGDTSVIGISFGPWRDRDVFDAFVLKPFSRKALVDAVYEVLRQREG